MINKVFKLSHIKHTGHLRAHEHTSYGPLIFFILVVGALLIGYSVSSYAANPGPQSGSIGLTGVVPEAPPKIAATISVPNSQQHFSTSPVTVSGSCPSGILVEIFENNIFAGSTPCDTYGNYSLNVNLLYGQNSLVAQVYDILNQTGPVSKSITVYNDVVQLEPSGLNLLNFNGTQLLLSTEAVYRGAFPNQPVNLPISILGGTPPYAININWGDSTNKVIPQNSNTVFNVSHEYDKPGTYKITLQGSDNQQQVAFLTVAAIINGQPGIVLANNGITNISKLSVNKLLVLWPLYAIVATLVIGFWTGEQREKRLINNVPKQQSPSFGITTHNTV